jgi:hypothetical protein
MATLYTVVEKNTRVGFPKAGSCKKQHYVLYKGRDRATAERIYWNNMIDDYRTQVESRRTEFHYNHR